MKQTRPNLLDIKTSSFSNSDIEFLLRCSEVSTMIYDAIGADLHLECGTPLTLSMFYTTVTP